MDKKSLGKELEITFENLLKELEKFDGKTINEVPFEGSWTAAQTTEHIIICGSGIPDMHTVKATRKYNEKVNAIRELFLNFDLKFKADPSLAPRSASYNKDELVREIQKIQVHLINVVETTEVEMMCTDMEFPSFGFLTRYEWLWFIVFHTQRHTHQILNIRKHLGKN